MHEKFKKSLIALISADKLSNHKFLLAVSGGVDSVFLLHMFYEIKNIYNFKLAIAHYNYKTSPNSIKSEELCRFYAKKFNIPIYVKRISESIENNFEGRARALRYEFFYSALDKHNYTNIITAHHKNDQIETLFMKKNEKDNVISMLGIRDVNKKVLRPLLRISKKSICKYVLANKITYIDDPTNKDNSYLRNRIRNIELKKSKNKQVIKNLLVCHRKAKKSFDSYLRWISDNRVEYVLYSAYYSALEIKREILNFISPDFVKIFIQSEILRYFNVHITKTDNFWKLLYQFLLTSKSGKYFILSENIKVYSYKNKIIVSFSSKEDVLDIKGMGITKKESLWNGTKFIIKDIDSSEFDGKYSIFIDRDIYQKGLQVLSYNECSSKIKKICENNYVYSYMKSKCPVVVDSDGKILWIPGVKSFGKESRKENPVKLNWDV